MPGAEDGMYVVNTMPGITDLAPGLKDHKPSVRTVCELIPTGEGEGASGMCIGKGSETAVHLKLVPQFPP